MKNRLTNYNFWISMVSAVLLILQAFDLQFDIEYINEIVTAVLGLLVVIGIISDPTKSSTVSSNNSTSTNQPTETTNTTKEETKGENANENEEKKDIEANKLSIGNNKEISQDLSKTRTTTDNLIEESQENAQPNETLEEISAETIPTIKETSPTNDIASNNFEVLIKQISTDLNKSMSELYKLQSDMKSNENIPSTILNPINATELNQAEQEVKNDNTTISNVDDNLTETITCHSIVQ